MLRTIHHVLNNDKYFRFAYFMFMSISVVLNKFVFPDSRNLYIFFIITVVFLGIGFYKMPLWVIFLLTLFTVISRFLLIDNPANDLETFLILLLTYLIIAFISVGLRQNVQRVNDDQIELTVALANALDSRDSYTMNHSEEVSKYAVQIAKQLGLSKEEIQMIRIGGLLHDIGKIGIPESILNKPGRLTEGEYNRIKTHSVKGYEMLKHVSSFHVNGVLDIVLYHHERYDGTGYPKGLKGEEIPLAARIISVADAFDAMSSTRVYRGQLDLDYALNEIKTNKGTQFDPAIADAFLSLFETTNPTFSRRKHRDGSAASK